MKKYLLIAVILLCVSLFSNTIVRDWKSYSNTTHISDIIKVDDQLLIATWGGLLTYDFTDDCFYGPLLESDGLVENEISSLAKLDDGTILIATKGGGISRMKDGEFLMPLNEDSGFDLDYVYAIESFGNNFAAVTNDGISVFTQLENWPLPTVQSYTPNNGLSSINISSLAVTCNNLIICGSDQGLDYAVLDDANNLQWQNLTTENSPLISNNVNDIFCNNSQIAIATRNGIHLISDFEVFASWNTVITGASYFPIALDDDGNIFTAIGYWDEDNLSVQDNSDIFAIKINSDGSQESWAYSEFDMVKGMLTSLLFDGNSIFAGTWGDGFCIYDGVWSQPYKQDCINANFVVEMYMDHQNNLWTAHGQNETPELRKGFRGVSCYNGEDWDVYVSENSGLVSNNVNSIVEADDGLMWFTSYANINTLQGGLNILDTRAGTEDWSFVADEDLPILSYQIADLEKSSDGTVWFSCYGGGVSALDLDVVNQYNFHAPRMLYDSNPNAWMVFQGEKYSVCGSRLSGFEVWNGDGRPYTDQIANWLRPDDEDNAITTGFISDAVERFELFEDQVWVASSEALFMYDGDTWYRYGKESTKRQYLTNSLDWEPKELEIGYNDSPDWWYFEGQEHLYGGATTYPTALLVDPFNVLWIGTANNGICRYDLENNLFMTWNKENSPLFSNYINDLAYDPLRGILYIATDKGLNSVRIGIKSEYNEQERFTNVIAYPNPFYPTKDTVVRIENLNAQTMPADAGNCKIFDLEGLLVRELSLNYFQQYEWDGNNNSGKLCSSGIYFYMVNGENGKSETGKIILIR